MVAHARTPKVVVLGMISKMPVAGVVWQTVQYLVGLERLGYETYYVEAHARTPSMLMRRDTDDSSKLAADFIGKVMRGFGMASRWAFHALHDDGACYGMSYSQLLSLYREAAAIINLHGGTQPLAEHSATGRLVYVETDPVQLQVELHNNFQSTLDFLGAHSSFFTYAENYGHSGCALPVDERFLFRPTRQPIVLDFWQLDNDAPREFFTTIGNWRQLWRDVQLDGETYTWSKHEEFLKFLELPRRTAQQFELALASCPAADRRLLRAHGWRVASALRVSRDLDRYRAYLSGSRAEFTVAKDQNVRLRTGWFSDRSACYLAAGRPVVTQETGFSAVLASGEGLFAFDTLDEIMTAVEQINARYAHHCQSARDLAVEFFAADKVLTQLLDGIGLDRIPHQGPSVVGKGVVESSVNEPAVEPIAAELDITVTSRRPTRLREKTVDAVLRRPEPKLLASRERHGSPINSVIVVTHENLAFTRLCVESVLLNTSDDYELIVVDNGSSDGTVDYLSRLDDLLPWVRHIGNHENRGFPHAVNQGLAAATGEVLVLLNNDTIVPDRWLEPLSNHLRETNVGLVGPVSNHAGNEARIATTYRTYGEMLAFSAQRREQYKGQCCDIPVATMFCVAMRRETYEKVGPLDEGFGTGLFEDDDYALRIRANGLRVVCAEDGFVHHFGEATFGHLVPTGDYGALFSANRALLERKWALSWQTHHRRVDPDYGDLVARIRTTVDAALPRDETVLVISRGDPELVRLPGRRAWHFPGAESGEFAGHHPADGAEAVELLQAAVKRGARHLVVPATEYWWLDHYRPLARYLENDCEVTVRNDDFMAFRLPPAQLNGDSARKATADYSNVTISPDKRALERVFAAPERQADDGTWCASREVPIVRLLPTGARVLIAGEPPELPSQYLKPFPSRGQQREVMDDLSLIAQLESQRAVAAEYFVGERCTGLLENQPHFRQYLSRRYEALEREDYFLADLRQQRSGEDLESVIRSVIEEFEARFGRSPAVLTHPADDDLARRFPYDAFFSSATEVLPYLNASVDVVIAGSTDEAVVAEARRVASTALVIADSPDHAGRPQHACASWITDAATSRPPSVAIVIPCFNGLELTSACLVSLFETLPPGFTGEVVIVDDCSQDGTEQMLQEYARRNAEISLVRNSQNLGFIRSCNAGAGVASADLLIFLNNDTVMLPGWLPPLRRLFFPGSGVGAAGGKLLYPDGLLQEAGGVLFRDGSGANFGRNSSRPSDPLFNYVRDVDYCSGALLATPRDLFQDIGGFDHRFEPAYYEDADYCFTVRSRGLQVLYQPLSAIVHREGGTSGTDLASGIKRHQVLNQERFVEKWKSVLSAHPENPHGFGDDVWHRLAWRPSVGAGR